MIIGGCDPACMWAPFLTTVDAAPEMPHKTSGACSVVGSGAGVWMWMAPGWMRLLGCMAPHHLAVAVVVHMVGWKHDHPPPGMAPGVGEWGNASPRYAVGCAFARTVDAHSLEAPRPSGQGAGMAVGCTGPHEHTLCYACRTTASFACGYRIDQSFVHMLGLKRVVGSRTRALRHGRTLHTF